MDGGDLTLAFDLGALRRLGDPAGAVADADRWSEHVGIVTDRPTHVLTKFARDHAIDQAFSPSPEPAAESLRHAKDHFGTDRHVHVGTRPEHEERATEAGWEYLDVEEAAGEAGWPLEGHSSSHRSRARVETSTDDWP